MSRLAGHSAVASYLRRQQAERDGKLGLVSSTAVETRIWGLHVVAVQGLDPARSTTGALRPGTCNLPRGFR